MFPIYEEEYSSPGNSNPINPKYDKHILMSTIAMELCKKKTTKEKWYFLPSI